jgi:HD-like signal output (HDOD) protein
MKVRKDLSASEVLELHQWLERKLDSVGLQSQPEVAVRLLELSGKKDSQLADYGSVIKNDQAVTGRVLRLANSAFFAQRKAVSTIDRACVVLGIERLKAVSLGFHLSRAAQASGGDQELARRIWGEAVYRGCLASELAKATAPGLSSEAFVIGLMMDSGLPLMRKLVGQQSDFALAPGSAPGKIYRNEFESLPCTHVDVVASLARRWKLPELLAKPLEWHHTKPPETKRDDPLTKLHRLAYVVGLVELTQVGPAKQVLPANAASPGVATAQRILNIADSDMSKAIRRASDEYSSAIEMFGDIAMRLPNLDDLVERVQVGLVSAMDDALEQQLIQPDSSASEAKPARIVLGGQSIELRKDVDGTGVAFLYDSSGTRLLSHRFEITDESAPADVCMGLGVEETNSQDLERLRGIIRKLAA